MPNKLERIKVSGFKSIRELDIELRDLNVLIGANGSGKSNFISLFELIHAIFQKRLQVYSGVVTVDSLLYYGEKTTKALDIQLHFEHDMYTARLIPSQKENFVFDEETFYYITADGQNHQKSFNGHAETRLDDIRKIEPVVDNYFWDEISNWKVYHFHDTGNTSRMKIKQNLHDNHFLRQDASNIAAYLYLLQEKYPIHYKRIVKTVRRIAPFFDDFVLRPDPLNDEAIRLQWHDVNSIDNIFNAHALSDGTLRFICLTTLLMQPDDNLPSLILIDEPELGLHPFAIHIVVAMLKSISTKVQVIISTQSVPLINQFMLEDIIVVDRKDQQSTYKHLQTKDYSHWIDEYNDYGVGDLWEKNILSGTPQREAN